MSPLGPMMVSSQVSPGFHRARLPTTGGADAFRR
jgi:hypothetical protein